MRPEQIPYGVKDFKRVRLENRYYVDKSQFIEQLGNGDFQDDAARHLRTVKAWYDSYCFARKKAGVESLYNCDMALYYLSTLVATGEPPKDATDAQLAANRLEEVAPATDRR